MVADCPSGFVTFTSAAPAACTGAVAVMLVLPDTTTAVAAVLPIDTVAPLTKLVPAIVITVPPAVGPDAGLVVEMVGAGAI